MKSLRTRFDFKISLFWRYFTLLAIVVLVFLIALTTSSNESVKVLQNSYVNQVQETFYHNCSSFSQDIALTRSLIATIQSSDYYLDLCSAQKPFSIEQEYFFSKMRTFFSRQCHLQPLVYDGFIYFNTSKTYITKNRVLDDTPALLDSYYLYENGLSMYSTLETYKIQNEFTVIPASDITIDDGITDSYLTLLIHPISSNLTCGFFCPTDKILDAFNIATLPDNTYLKITSYSDEVLFSHNDTGGSSSDYIEFTSSLPSLNSNATLGIPLSYFEELLDESLTAAQGILILSLVIGIILCVCFSYIGVKPFHFLMHEHTLIQEENKNEVDAINNYLKNTKKNNETLRGMLLSGLLTRALYALPAKASEYENLTTHFPTFQKPQRLAIVQDRRSLPNSIPRNSVFDTLLDQLPGEIICEHISLSEVCIIMQDELVSCEMLQRILVEMNIEYQKAPQFVCGISAPFTGLDNISMAMRQAQFALPKDEERIVGLFTENEGRALAASSPKAFDPKHFEQELGCWNENEVLNIIRNYRTDASRHDLKHPEETFYTILYLLRDTAQAGAIDFSPYEETAYLHNITPEANLKVLEDIVLEIFSQKEKLQVSETRQLCENLVQYVKDNYSNPILSVPVLAQEFCVSERFTQKSILSVSGMNFTRLLLETRMVEAARLLRETDMSNIAISELCGYTTISTFYRNFKAYYNKTPAEYKESFSSVK